LARSMRRLRSQRCGGNPRRAPERAREMPRRQPAGACDITQRYPSRKIGVDQLLGQFFANLTKPASERWDNQAAPAIGVYQVHVHRPSDVIGENPVDLPRLVQSRKQRKRQVQHHLVTMAVRDVECEFRHGWQADGWLISALHACRRSNSANVPAGVLGLRTCRRSHHMLALLKALNFTTAM
jgi:hypothetical protein